MEWLDLRKGRQMRTGAKIVLFVGLAGQALLLSGCYGSATCLSHTMADYKRTDEIQVDSPPGAKFVVHNEGGAIRIWADEGTDCRITARVYVHAPHKQEARELGEQVQIAAEPNDGTVRVTVKKPPMSQEHRFVVVDLDILVPRKTPVECRTEFGEIRLAGIEGDVTAATEFGPVFCEGTQGALDLRTEFGRVTGREINSERLSAKSECGSVDIACSAECPPELTADVSTGWGKVRFQAPPGYQGQIDLQGGSSGVRSALPVLAPGSVSRHRITGTIGSGQGKLRLVSESGSVRLR